MMRRIISFVFAFLIILSIGCSDSKSKSDIDAGPDLRQDTFETMQDVKQTDTGKDITKDTIQCTCDQNNECCDGCTPINEGQLCGEIKPCFTSGKCQAGKCVGGGQPLKCDSPEPCQEGPGSCDPKTGKCIYSQKSDGTLCAAKSGIDGSGICQAGKCHGFGKCDHHDYDQGVGYACNFDSECKSGICKNWGNDWAKYCTAECGKDLPPCPDGTLCVNDGKDRFCRPLGLETMKPGDATQELYQVCNRDEDCKGGLCLSMSGTRFCSGNCESRTKPGSADDSACGDCGVCRTNGDTLKFKYKFYCVPKGTGKLGDPCEWSGDCISRFCIQGKCSFTCVEVAGKSNCPEGTSCVSGVVEGVKVCVPDKILNRKLGEPCKEDYWCKDGLKCMAMAGKRYCLADCTKKACTEGNCVTYTRNKKLCVPDQWVGKSGPGGDCDVDFQCQEGLSCVYNRCIKRCRKAEDCENSTCYDDVWRRLSYCVNSCQTDQDCTRGTNCIDGKCLLNAGHGVYLNGPCRTDDDCVTGLCLNGVCTDECSDNAPCEDGIKVDPATAMGMCAPCDPNKLGTDCTGDALFYNCIQDIEGKWFCAIDCGVTGSGSCPVGTRCYSTASGAMACAPMTGSCNLQAKCSDQGVCGHPLGDTMPCADDADCGRGGCNNGRCLGPKCQKDDDCGCDLLACKEGVCTVSGQQVMEQEPNDSIGQAQEINDKNQIIVSSLMPGDKPDSDIFRVELKAGEHMDAWTQPFCKQFAYTHLSFLNKQGAQLKNWDADALAQKYPFSLLSDYQADTDQTLFIRVTQGEYYMGMARYNYLLGVNIFTPAANSDCNNPVNLPNDGRPHEFDLSKAANTMTAKSCTGSSSMGKDMAFRVTIPAGRYVTVDADTPFDSLLYFVTDCADTEKSCVMGADSVWKPGPEQIIYANHGNKDQDLTLVVDSFLPSANMKFRLTATATDITEAQNNTVSTAISLPEGKGNIQGNNIGATNDYDTGKDGCVGAALPGRDVVYSLEIKPGAIFNMVLLKFAGIYPAFVLTTDPTDPKGCLAVNQGKLSYQNKTNKVQKAWLVIDSVIPDGYSTFTIEYYLGQPNRRQHLPMSPRGRLYKVPARPSWTPFVQESPLN